jgi:PleD family two-component response regulator
MLTVNSNSRKPHQPDGLATREASSTFGLFSRDLFLQLLNLEHQRAERSGRPFILMLLQSMGSLPGRREETLQKLARTLSSSTRKTDVKGWYDSESTIGVIFTEFGSSMEESDVDNLLAKVTGAIHGSLSLEESNQLKLSYGVYPERASAYSMLAERKVRAAQA